jgi:hypothetical protein
VADPMTEAVDSSRPTQRRPGLLRALILLLALGDALLLGWIALRRPEVRGNDPAGSLRGAMAVLHREGLPAALDSLEQWSARDSVVLRAGHQMAHALGRQAVAERGGDVAVIRECRPAFASGCYHGVVEAALQAGGRLDMARLQQLCAATEAAAGPGPGYECVHGLGHGVLGAVKYDLESALHLCDALSTASLRESCHSGAFMEAISSVLGAPAPAAAHDHTHGAGHEHPAAGSREAATPGRLAIDLSDPYSPCDRFGDPYASSCWLFQGFVILRRHGFDVAQSLRVCDSAPEGRVQRCYESIGHQLTGLFQHDDAWIIEQCSRGRNDRAPWCAAGAALALDALDWSGTRAARLCAAAPAAWKEACYRSASGALVDLAPASQRVQFCASIETAYAKVCREAAAADVPRRPS